MNIFRKKQKVNPSPIKEVRQEDKILEKIEEKLSVPRILVYGIERVGLRNVENSIKDTNFLLEFAEFGTIKKFQDYDGVVLFQSAFEVIKKRDSYGGGYLEVIYDRDELVKRRNQLSQLLDKGGFACFLIHRNFIDKTQYQGDVSDTDLCKIYLNYDRFYRTSLEGDIQISKIYRSEFRHFLKDYGIARVGLSFSSGYEPYIKKICEDDYGKLTGFILLDNRYFIPCFLPDENDVADFFKKLTLALVATSKKLIQEIPLWVDSYRFKNEEKILEEETELQKRIEELQKQKDIYKKYKRCLCHDGDLLVESVENLLKDGFSFILDDKKDENIEDKVILDSDHNKLALVEIKGTNENIKNININQADMHRSRREKPSDFPSILIVNTFIKSSNTIEDKLKDVQPEQIKLAFDRKILIMRTIDLLNLLYLKEQGRIQLKDINEIFIKKYGFLSVSREGYEIKEK